MIENLSAADFKAHLGETFGIRLENGELYEMTLTQALETGERVQPGGRAPFSLEFSHPRKDAYLPQQIYRLEHPALGPLELFIVPLGPGQGRMRYEVVFG